MNIATNNKLTEDNTEIHYFPPNPQDEDAMEFWAVTVNGEWITSEPDEGQYPGGHRWLLRAEASSWRVLCLCEEQAEELRDKYLEDVNRS